MRILAFASASVLVLAAVIPVAAAEPQSVVVADTGGGRDQRCQTYKSQLGNGADGCAAAKDGLVKVPNLFEVLRESGQDPYLDANGNPSAHPAMFNVPTLDYGDGQYTPDKLLTDASATHPGCSLAFVNQLRCNSGGTFEHMRFYDLGVYDGGGVGALSSTFYFDDIHATIGANSCRAYGGVAFFRAGGYTTVKNSTFDYDLSVCAPYAYLFGQPGDPGLSANSSGVVDMTATSMTFKSPPTGTVRQYSYINCFASGCVPGIITAYNADTLTATICPNPYYPTSGHLTPSCTGSEPTRSNISVTTGPIQSTNGSAVNSNYQGDFEYNAVLDFPTSWQMSGATDGAHAIAKYNYARLISPPNLHNQFLVWLTNPGANSSMSASVDQTFNVAYYAKLSYYGTGTGLFAIFGNGQTAQSQVTWDHINTSFNIGVANRCINPGGTTGCAKPYHTNNSLVRLTSQTAGGSFAVHFHHTPGVLTIDSVEGTGIIGVGSQIIGNFGSPPVRVLAIGGTCDHDPCTGTGGVGTYKSLNTIADFSTSKAGTISNWQGIVNQYTAVGNLFDGIGDNGGVFNVQDWNFWVKSADFTSVPNHNMRTGQICTPSSC